MKQWKRMALLAVCCLLPLGAVMAAAAQKGTEVPILMYHHISDTFVSSATMTSARFREQMQALADAGYQAVSFADLIAYAEREAPLPEKPIVITFDDGYQSNLDIAAPVLEELGYCGEVAVIGACVGHASPSLAYFSMEDARPWVERGVLEIGAHSYGMHLTEPRLGVSRMKGEDNYEQTFTEDTEKVTAVIADGLGTAPVVYAYPYGRYEKRNEELLTELGYRVTLTTREGTNRIVPGDPGSLRELNRLNMTEEMTGEQLLARLRALS